MWLRRTAVLLSCADIMSHAKPERLGVNTASATSGAFMTEGLMAR